MSLKYKLKTAIIGATGFTGLDLTYYLSKHPKVKIMNLCATKNLGKKISYLDKRIKKKLPNISSIKNLDWKNIEAANKRPAEDSEEGIGLLLQHVKDLCGNADFYEYFLDSLAFKLKYPTRKNNIAYIFKSLQGAGKDSFFDWFGNEMIDERNAIF